VSLQQPALAGLHGDGGGVMRGQWGWGVYGDSHLDSSTAGEARWASRSGGALGDDKQTNKRLENSVLQ
jgi:hypothetical protein